MGVEIIFIGNIDTISGYLYTFPQTQSRYILFFFKHLFFIMFLLERRIYREERQRGRSSFRWFTPQVSATADAMPTQSQEPLLGLPRGCRVPKLWAILNCFPGPQAGSWKGSGAAGIRTGAHMGSRACKVRTLTTAPPRRALQHSFTVTYPASKPQWLKVGPSSP